jgi:hypothetical protein
MNLLTENVNKIQLCFKCGKQNKLAVKVEGLSSCLPTRISFHFILSLLLIWGACQSNQHLISVVTSWRCTTIWRLRSLYLYPPGTGWPSYTPRALGSLYVASYDSQGYDGGILTRLHTELTCFQVKVKVMLRQTVSQSCLGVKFTLGLVTRYYILSESCCVVSVGRPLWQEVGSVSCQSLSAVFSPLSKI